MVLAVYICARKIVIYNIYKLRRSYNSKYWSLVSREIKKKKVMDNIRKVVREAEAMIIIICHDF